MVLAVNIGNTHICIGGYENGAQAFSAKLSSEPPRTADEYALQLRSLLAMRGLGGAAQGQRDGQGQKDGKTFHGVMVLVVVSSAPELG